MAGETIGAFSGAYGYPATGEPVVVVPALLPEDFAIQTGFDIQAGTGSTRPESGQLFPRGDK
jgi:hypothetical protein